MSARNRKLLIADSLMENTLMQPLRYVSLCVYYKFKILAQEQRAGTGSSQLDLPDPGRTRSLRKLRRHPSRRNRSVQPHEQTGPWKREEDPVQGHQLPAHGKYRTIPKGRERIWTPTGRDLPDG